MASDAVGDSKPSIILNATPASSTSVPAAPSDLVATGANAEVSLSWTPVSGAISYKVFYQAGSSATTSGIQAPASMISGATALITGLANGTQYAFVVVASNGMGDSMPSLVVTATPTATTSTDPQAVAADKAALAIGYASGDSAASVTQNLSLPTSGPSGTTITWSSDHPTIVSNSGIVVRPTSTTAVTLTATIKKGGASDAKPFALTVLVSDAAIVAADKAALAIGYASGDSYLSVTQGLSLPTSGSSGSSISWASAPSGIVGSTGAVARPSYTTSVTLTATIAKGGASDTRPFALYVIGTAASKGYLYVGGGDLEAYRINADGSLTLVPGSPFATNLSLAGGAVDPGNKHLYMVGGSGVYAYGINPDGSLAPISGSPVSAGYEPSSIAITPSTTYAFVTNAGSEDNSISAFSFASSGLPIPVTGSPFPVTPSGTPTSAVIAPNGLHMYVCDSNGAYTSDVQAWTINADGSLAKDGASITTYDDNFYGSIAIAPSGGYVYACHAFSDNITAYSTNADGTLTELTSLGSPFGARTGSADHESEALAMTPSGRYLYTVQAWDGESVCCFRINSNGSLTALTGLVVSSSSIPYSLSLAIDSSSSFVYIPNHDDNKVYLFGIDPSSGILSPLSSASIAAASPQALVATH